MRDRIRRGDHGDSLGICAADKPCRRYRGILRRHRAQFREPRTREGISGVTRRHLMTLRLLLVLADAITAAGVFLLVSLVRFEADPAAQWSVGIHVLPAAVLFAVTWVSVF